MSVAVAFVQYAWFSEIAISEEGFIEFGRSEHEACYYPGPLPWERAKFPHAMLSRQKLHYFILF
jgi:hypothetical protein